MNIAHQTHLYEVLGIIRFIGMLNPDGKDRASMIRDQETAAWAARAAERIIEEVINDIDNSGE